MLKFSNLHLRNEQKAAVSKTKDFYYEHIVNLPQKFLWNAKPRFGKTVAAYALAGEISAERILIVTNRPSIADSWTQDYFRFFAERSNYIFATSRGRIVEVDGKSHRTYSRHDIIKNKELLSHPIIFFISLQDLKGHNSSDSRSKSSNQWIFDLPSGWDLLIVDEGHDGVKTDKTSNILSRIHTKLTLYLSGTPFRAIADEDFNADEIFNWTYLDEQSAKTNWTKRHPDDTNPYKILPEIECNLYSFHDIIPDIHSFTELFKINQTEFQSIDQTKLFLDFLAGIYRQKKLDAIDLRHTLWMMPGVQECRMMKTLLSTHPFFSAYHINIVVGKDHHSSSQLSHLSMVRKGFLPDALSTKTITLTCGQLTTGVTIPEWSAVFMLYGTEDLEFFSATQYLQTMFRVQNPWQNSRYVKNKCFLFDFLPSRAIMVLQKYANSLCHGYKDPFNELVKYLPVYYHSGRETYLKLNTNRAERLTKNLIAQEIVDNKFTYSDKLFRPEILQNSDLDIDILLGGLNQFSKGRLIKNDSARAHRKIHDITGAMTAKTKTSTNTSQLSRNRDKLRSITRILPLLVLYKNQPISNLARFTQDFPADAFEYFMGITKEDFAHIIKSKCLNETNCCLATEELYTRFRDNANYYGNEDFINIFSFIPESLRNFTFTPDAVARRLVSLTAIRPELFDQETVFLDPCAKSGAIVMRIIQKLFTNTRDKFNSDHDCLLHILTQQIYAWSPNTFMRQLCLNNILSPHKFGFVTFSPPELEQISEHFQILDPEISKKDIASQLIHQRIESNWGINMKFDVIISNPPYQNGRHQVYADFYRMAVELNPEILCMIFPSGWQKPQNHNGLGQLNNAKYKRDPHIVSIDNYNETEARKLFSEINPGSLNIILRDTKHDNGGKITRLKAGHIAGEMVLPLTRQEINKPQELLALLPLVQLSPKLSALGTARKPYGFYADPLRNPEKYHLHPQRQRNLPDDVRLFGLMSDGARGYKYIPRHELPKTSSNLDRYKLFVPKAWGNMSERIGLGGSYANICVASPGDACSETFIEFGPFDSKEQTINIAKYFMTKFFRALLFLAKDSQNTARDKYCYVPLPDLATEIWKLPINEIDEKLFDLYKVPAGTRLFILDHIQSRNETNIEIL